MCRYHSERRTARLVQVHDAHGTIGTRQRVPVHQEDIERLLSLWDEFQQTLDGKPLESTIIDRANRRAESVMERGCLRQQRLPRLIVSEVRADERQL